MNLRIIRAIVMKDLVDVLKNKSLVTLLVVPLFIAALYLVFNIAIQTPSRVLAYNPDGVPLSDTLKLGQPLIKVDNAIVLPFLDEIPVLSQALYLLPTSYMANGVYGAATGDLSFDKGLLDAGLMVAFTIAAFIVAAWLLRRRTLFA